MNEFISMGGYAFYVWSSYGMSGVVLLLVFFWPIMQRRKLMQHLKHSRIRLAKLERRQQ